MLSSNLQLRPAWIEINLDNLHANLAAVRRQAPNVKILLAVKANAYGVGIVEASKELASEIDYFGVAFLQEALALRQADLANPVLIFGPARPSEAESLVKHNLDQTVTSWESAEKLSAAGLTLGRPLRIHLKVDTGMGRLGLMPSEIPEFMRKLSALKGISLEGIFSHFPANLNNFPEFTRHQLSVFLDLIRELRGLGHRLPLCHIASSNAVFQNPASHLDMVRPGSCVYGMSKSVSAIKPVITLKAQITHIRSVPAGTFLSYGLTYQTKTETQIAVLPLGYADGFPRALSNRGTVLIRNKHYPIVGVICMDQTLIDIGNDQLQIGDEAVLIGRQGEKEISFYSIVDLVEGTSANELSCGLSLRLPRVYLRQGKPVYVNQGYLAV